MIKYISNGTNKTYSKVKTKKNLKKNKKIVDYKGATL